MEGGKENIVELGGNYTIPTFFFSKKKAKKKAKKVCGFDKPAVKSFFFMQYVWK